MQRFRLVFMKTAFEKQAILQVRMKIPKKRSKPTAKYIENSKTAPTIYEKQVSQRAQYDLALQLVNFGIDVDPSGAGSSARTRARERHTDRG